MPMEWDVFTVLVAVAGLFLSVGTPIIKLNSTITKLNVLLGQMQKRVENIDGEIEDIRQKSKESHRRIWEHNTEQDDKLNNHETRIAMLERKND